VNFLHNDAAFGLHTEYFKRATFDGNYSRGTRINYDSVADRKPFLAQGSELNAQITLRPSARMKLEEIYFLTRLRARADSFPGVPRTVDGRPAAVFVNHLARSRLNYQFTRELSLRLIVDYNGVIQNPSLTSLTRQKHVTGDVLITYLIHPGTAFYVGYTDRLENLTLGPGAPASVLRTASPSSTVGRQFFVKLSYLWRL
jgi:hypothetical protein